MSEFRTDHGIKLFGVYPGEVVQHGSGGNCKVYIPGVYSEECSGNPNKLPWALQSCPLFGGINNGNGCFSYPNIGAKVLCMFINGDQNYPLIIGSILGGEMAIDDQNGGYMSIQQNVSPSDSAESDTTKNGQDSQEHLITCGDSRIIIRECGKTEIICEENGKNNVFAKIIIDKNEGGSITIESSNDIKIKSNSNLNIESDDSLTLKSTNIQIVASRALNIQAPKTASVNDDSFYVESPNINLNASSGALTARGAMFKPLYLA